VNTNRAHQRKALSIHLKALNTFKKYNDVNYFEVTGEIVIKLDFVQGSLLDYEVDMLVNASNTTLRLGSGVSMVLKRASGPELQHSMDQLRLQRTRANQEILPGDVFIW
jgi:hypothetical protein